MPPYNNCTECSKAITGNTPHIKCNGCENFVHLACLGISTEDAACITRNKLKNIKLYCTKCSNRETKMDELMKKICARDSKLDEITKKIDEIFSNFESRLKILEDKNSSGICDYTKEELTQEAVERVKRSSNVIVTRLPETSLEMDLAAAKEIVNETTKITNVNLSVIRLGRTVTGADSSYKTRPLKIVLGDPNIAREVLRNKNKLLKNDKYKTVKLFDDQTPTQRDYLRKMREELKIRVENGEPNLTIKYVRGRPTICDTQATKN